MALTLYPMETQKEGKPFLHTEKSGKELAKKTVNDGKKNL